MTKTPRSFDHVDTWVFDLDNTLYPHHVNLWQQVDKRISEYVSRWLDITGQPKQVYSFAEAVDADNRTIKLKDKPLNWGGPKELCTRESKFETNEQGDCTSRGFVASGFAAVDMASGGKTLRFAVP